MTLAQLVKEHPEWLGHDLVIYTESGYQKVGEEAMICEATGRIAEGKKQLVFSPN